MWSLITSNGQRVDGIRGEEQARRTAQTLGITTRLGVYSWSVLDNHGQRFAAEIRHSYDTGRW